MAQNVLYLVCPVGDLDLEGQCQTWRESWMTCPSGSPASTCILLTRLRFLPSGREGQEDVAMCLKYTPV